MKFLAVFAVVVAVAAADLLLPVAPAAVGQEQAEIMEIIAAINHPSTDPATAAALEQMLFDLLGLNKPEEIEVGPAIVDEYEPISVGPAIVDGYEPISVGPAIVDFPVAAEVAAAPSSPLVQIIVNVQSESQAVNPAPAVVEEAPIVPSPINPSPVIIVDPMPEPAVIPPAILPTPVIVEEPQPEAVVVGTPILPTPVINVPETLN